MAYFISEKLNADKLLSLCGFSYINNDKWKIEILQFTKLPGWELTVKDEKVNPIAAAYWCLLFWI